MIIRKIKGKRKLNNKGMTLVEILIATLILSVVSITFLETMSYSLKLNVKAKEQQHALSFSQTLMEGFKAYDRDTLDKQFDDEVLISPDMVANGDFKLFHLADGDGSDREVIVSGNDRTYKLSNVEFNEKYFDATITTTPITASEALLVTVEDINKYNDGIFRQRKNENALVLEDVQAYLNTQGDEFVNTDSAYVNGIKLNCIQVTSRVIDVQIASNDSVSVTVTYTYNIINHPIEDASGNAKLESDGVTPVLVNVTGETAVISYPEPSPDMSDSNDVEAAHVIYSKTGDPYDPSLTPTSVYGAKLERLYLFYYPAYASLTGNAINGRILSCASDSINITNLSNNLKDIVLIKQRNPDLNSGTFLAEGEANYGITVNVNSSSSNLDISHNLGTILAGSVGTPIYHINGAANDMHEPWATDTAITTLVYNVTIEITKHGETEVLSVLNGTTNAK